MIIEDAKFERIERKISDIQAKIDFGIVAANDNEAALGAIRGARTELFALRSLLRESIEIEPTTQPPSAA